MRKSNRRENLDLDPGWSQVKPGRGQTPVLLPMGSVPVLRKENAAGVLMGTILSGLFRVACCWFCMADRGLARPVTVHPPQDTSSFSNPLRGWVAWWENKEIPPQPCSLVFAYQRWKDVEPREGQYRFEAWDQENLRWWWDHGFDVILRLELDYPRKEALADIPDYVLARNRGTWYDKKEIGQGYSPDYDDPYLLERLEKLIAAWGAHYEGQPQVPVIQHGIIGHWGEWHTWPEGSGKMPSEETTGRIVKALKKALPRKYLQIRYHNKWSAGDARVGFHDDCWGELTSCTDGNWCTKFNLELFNLGNRWKTAPNGGEFCDPSRFLVGSESDFQKALKEVRDFHASWLGPAAGCCDKAPSGRLSEMEKALGYRFVVEEAIFDDETKPGQPWRIQFRVRNAGSAPFYFPWKPELALLDDKGEELWTAVLGADPMAWLPGQLTEVEESVIPSPLKGEGRGKVLTPAAVVLSLRDPHSSRRARFASTPRDSQGRLNLGAVTLN
jgi:hypothetical protein